MQDEVLQYPPLRLELPSLYSESEWGGTGVRLKCLLPWNPLKEFFVSLLFCFLRLPLLLAYVYFL